MPTATASEEEVNNVYEQLESLHDKTRADDNVIVMEDWNVLVGEVKEKPEMGKFGLGKRNIRGQRLVDFCN